MIGNIKAFPFDFHRCFHLHSGWALCGHQLPAGQGEFDPDSDEDNGEAGPQSCNDANCGDSQRGIGQAHKAPNGPEPNDAPTSDLRHFADRDAEPCSAPVSQSHDLSTPRPPAGSVPPATAAATAAVCHPESTTADGFDPLKFVPRERRIAIGQKCKELIDIGRWHWLQQRCPSTELVEYISPQISGENRLLVAAVQRGET